MNGPKPYHAVTPEIIEEIITILGKYNAAVDTEKLETYSHDETPEEYSRLPEVVIAPWQPIEVFSIPGIP